MDSSNHLTVIEILRRSTGYLEEKGVESPRLTAEILLSDILRCERIDLYLWFDRPMEEGELYMMRRYLRLRARGMPVDYITGNTEFYGLRLHVDPRVMIPRPETEVLVEKTLNIVDAPLDGRRERSDLLLLDLGTGSGAIALAMLDQLRGSRAMGVDSSLDALRVACANADSLDLARRFFPVQGDFYSPLKRKGQFDLVVSNPPYIPDSERENLPRVVRDYEPPAALFAGPDGLSCIAEIVERSGEYLKPGGLLAVEIGEKQGEAVIDLIEHAPAMNLLSLEKDLSGVERVVLASKEAE